MSRSVQMNSKMSDRLSQLVKERTSRGPLLPAYVELLNEGFVDWDDCVFLSRLAQNASPVMKKTLDKTGIEAFINHFHLDEYGPADPLAQLEQGLLVLFQLI